MCFNPKATPQQEAMLEVVSTSQTCSEELLVHECVVDLLGRSGVSGQIHPGRLHSLPCPHTSGHGAHGHKMCGH